MDIFAIVLLTVTILTICGICFFLCICTLQPKVIHYVQRKKSRTYHIMALTQVIDIDGNLDPATMSSLNDQRKRAYLKILERSVRTGRRIQDEKDNHYVKNTSRSTSFYSLGRYITKHLSRKTPTTDNQRSTDI